MQPQCTPKDVVTVETRHVNQYLCPANKKICKICGKLNHFAKVCREISDQTESQDELERKIDETYEDLNGVMAIVDDILIYGKSKAEHDEHLLTMLQRYRQRAVKLNPEKSIIGATEVSYFGHLLTAERVKPDPAKAAAVRDMEPPKDKGELETVLGMINYLSKFAPGLADVNAQLRQLLKDSSEFVQHDRAFNRIKELLKCEPGPVLAYFDPLKELRLQVDASKYGLGAVLLQDERPIAYASKSLSAMNCSN
ncbi:hypothetical protein QTP86_028882 [Hemibagrus guttatus]|nr:hypothetical protein QTP86_028882 [Hemibagrus guttatus]